MVGNYPSPQTKSLTLLGGAFVCSEYESEDLGGGAQHRRLLSSLSLSYRRTTREQISIFRCGNGPSNKQSRIGSRLRK